MKRLNHLADVDDIAAWRSTGKTVRGLCGRKIKDPGAGPKRDWPACLPCTLIASSEHSRLVDDFNRLVDAYEELRAAYQAQADRGLL